MTWQSDIIKYGFVVGAVGVGGYFLINKINRGLAGPAEAASAAAEQANQALTGAGEALGSAAEAAGEVIGGVPETVGDYIGTVTACPFCNGLPNVLGTPCAKCSEHGQQKLPQESGQEIPQKENPLNAENYTVQWSSGQIADIRLSPEAAQYYKDTPGVNINKSDILGDIQAWFRSDPLGLNEVSSNLINPVKDVGENIQTWALGGASSFTEWVFPSSAPVQDVANGQSFDNNTGFEVAQTGINPSSEEASLNIGNNSLDTAAAPINQGTETVNTVNGSNLIHNDSSSNFGSSTVPNTSSPSVNQSNTAHANFNHSSAGNTVAPGTSVSSSSSSGTPSAGTGGSGYSGSGRGAGGASSSGNSSSSGSSSAGGSTTSSSSRSGGSGSTGGGTSSSSSSGTASSGNSSSSSRSTGGGAGASRSSRGRR